jgi:hypothetical protein
MNVASVELPPLPDSVPAARRLVGELTGHLPRRTREAAELVASELATNSVVHARTPFTVFTAVDDDGVEVVVADHAGWAPGSAGSSGQGLLLVGLLASDWAAVIEDGGKRVWARLDLDDAAVL